MAALDRNYDSPEFNVTRDQQFAVAIASSTLRYARFVARARMYVTNVIVGLTSVASLAALQCGLGIHADSNGATAASATGKSATWLSATSLGSVHTIALNRTLALGEALSLVFNDAKGKVHVVYEYQILPA